MRNHDDKLYTIVMECARLNDQGCACQCHACQFNIFNYVKDVREGSLLKATAYTDYHKSKELKRQIRTTDFAMDMGPLIVLALIVAGIMWCCSSVSNPKQTPDSIYQLNRSVTSGVRTSLPMTDEVRRFLRDQNNIKNVPGILAIMPHVVYDTNRDGQINCIDYSCVFRELYGRNAYLIINRNQRTNMHHMFIRIWDESGEYHIEPQGTPNRYSMGLIWGQRYNPSYNRNVTSEYGQIFP